MSTRGRRHSPIGLLALLLTALASTVHAQNPADFGYGRIGFFDGLGRRVRSVPLLVILIEEPGRPFAAGHDANFYRRLLFGGDLSQPSTLGFFYENSYANFEWRSGGVVGPFSLRGADYKSLEETLAATIRIAGEQGGVNFARFDTDRDGRVSPDELAVITFDTRTDNLAAMRRPPAVNLDRQGVVVDLHGAAAIGHRASFTVINHEIVHLLGAEEDLYDYGMNWQASLMGTSEGALDGRQSWHLDPWHKMQLGWAQPRIRDMRVAGSELLPAAQVGNTPLLLWDPSRGTGEFFLLEFRSNQVRGALQAPGSYDANVISNGLAVWHCNQDPRTKRMIRVRWEVDPSKPPARGIFYRGMPGWRQGGGPLFQASDGVIAPRWMDGSDTGIRVAVGAPSNNGEYLPVRWWKAIPWHDWQSLGGVLPGNVAVGPAVAEIAFPPRRGRWLEVFVRGTDNALWRRRENVGGGDYAPWERLGGVLTSDPAVGENADGRLEVFWRGSNNDLQLMWQLTPEGAFSGGLSLGGGLTSNIAVGRNADGRLEAFVRGGGNALYSKYKVQVNGKWSDDWAYFGGALASDPVVAQNADGRLEVFARGGGDALYHIYQTAPSNGWSRWESLGGAIIGKPAVGRNADGRLEVFVRGVNNALYSKVQLRPGGREWSDWFYFGGTLTGDPAVGQTADGRLVVFVRWGDQALYQIHQTAPNGSGGWSSWEALGGAVNSNITVARNPYGLLEVFVRGTDNALHRRLQRP